MTEAIADLAARVRGSVVGVISPTSRGTGYCALPNGLIVTSLDVVGYEREVQIVLDDGASVSGVVVRANVPLDVALVMPLDPVDIPPLEPAPEPRIGEEALLVGRVGAELTLAVSRIVATSRIAEGFAHLQLDASIEDTQRGAPLVDGDGRVYGIVSRPRRSRLIGDRNAFEWLGSLVLPGSAYEGGLHSSTGPLEELLELQLEYGCPGCDTVFEPELDRCLECGIVLPHRFLRAEPLEALPTPLKGLFAVKAALASMGIPATRARVGQRTWRFSPALEDQDTRTQVDLTMDGTGDYILLHAPVARLPPEGFEHVYRHLLTLNDETSGPFRLGVVGSIVYLSCAEPTASLGASSFPGTVSDLSRTLSQYRATLAQFFGLEPAFENDIDG